ALDFWCRIALFSANPTSGAKPPAVEKSIPSLLPPVPAATPTAPLTDPVRQVQDRLTAAGYNVGTDPPGTLGSGTSIALRVFQRDHGLPATGAIDASTLEALGGRVPPEEIPLQSEGDLYTVPAQINGVLTLHFLLDTGASEVNIPADVALTLLRTGTIKDPDDFLPGAASTLADGTKVTSFRFTIRSLTIGHRRITNVPASIGKIASPLLLGQSFLKRLGTWSMDSQRQVLVLGPSTMRNALLPPKEDRAQATSQAVQKSLEKM